MITITASIIAALASVLVGVLTLIGVIITNNRANFSIQARLEKSQAVTDTKIEELTREVRLHNNFASRIPVIEAQLNSTTRRVANLENNNHGGFLA